MQLEDLTKNIVQKSLILINREIYFLCDKITKCRTFVKDCMERYFIKNPLTYMGFP